MENDTRDVYGYIRVSTEVQEERGFGIDTQDQAIRQYCQHHDLNLKSIFYDKGISGTAIQRPGLLEMIATVTEDERIIVLNTSRLWREDFPKAMIKRELQKRKTDVISIESPKYTIYDNKTDPGSVFMNSVMEAIDVYERLTINLKLFKGRQTKARSGIQGSGKPPLGYKWNRKGERSRIVVDNNNAEVVKEIFNQYIKAGSLDKVRTYLTEQNYKTTNGNDFSTATIGKILRNRFYLGELKWGEIETVGKQDPIVNKIVFGKANAMLSRNNRKQRRQNQ